MSRVSELLLAVDALDDLLVTSKRVPMTAWVRLDPQDYLRIVATLREGAREISDFERGRAAAPITESLDALERIGRQSTRLPLTSKRGVDPDEVRDQLDRLRAVLPAAYRRAVEAERWRRLVCIELSDPAVPSLEALVERVVDSDEGFVVLRAGKPVAELRAPAPRE